MELQAEIELDAPPQQVWAVLLDFGAYGQWNPFLVSVAGELLPGAPLNLVVSLPEGPELRLNARVTRVQPGEELRLASRMLVKGLFDTELFWKLRESEPGKTRFRNGGNFGGWLLESMGRRLTLYERGFVYMNQALRKRLTDLR